MNEHEKDKYSDFITVEKNRKEIMKEQTPEGPYGSPIEGTLQKTTPWTNGQQSVSGFTWENKNLHQNKPRHMPGAHFPHDDKRIDRENPY